MTPTTKEKIHDCTCGIDGRDSDPCACPCKMCGDYRATVQRYKRLEELKERLKKAGIDPKEFADLMWMEMEPTIESRVERITRDVLRIVLKDLKLQTRVSGSSLDWQSR